MNQPVYQNTLCYMTPLIASQLGGAQCDYQVDCSVFIVTVGIVKCEAPLALRLHKLKLYVQDAPLAIARFPHAPRLVFGVNFPIDFSALP